MTIPITTQASDVAGSRLRLVPAYDATEVEHVLDVPRGACPVSKNPIGGTVSIAYAPAEHTLEVVTLHEALTWACTSREAGAPRSVEELAHWLAEQAGEALGVPVTVRLDVLVNPGPQRLVVTRRRPC